VELVAQAGPVRLRPPRVEPKVVLADALLLEELDHGAQQHLGREEEHRAQVQIVQEREVLLERRIGPEDARLDDAKEVWRLHRAHLPPPPPPNPRLLFCPPHPPPPPQHKNT